MGDSEDAEDKAVVRILLFGEDKLLLAKTSSSSALSSPPDNLAIFLL